MILVTSPSKPFEFTEKRQPRRNIILKAYQDEIEAIYKEVMRWFPMMPFGMSVNHRTIYITYSSRDTGQSHCQVQDQHFEGYLIPEGKIAD